MTTYADPDVRSRRYPGRRRNPPPPPMGGRRDPLWAKICLILGSLVMVISGAAVMVPKLVAYWAGENIPRGNLIPPGLIGTNIDGAINVLLLGMDERITTTPSTEPIRADTIIIVHIPATHDAVYMMSIPRDARVAIPAFPETGFGGSRGDKVNAAFAFGARKDGRPDSSTEGRSRGANLTIQTLSQLMPGLTFNAAAIVNFYGMDAILKALGGVTLCVDVETRSIHFDKNNVYHTLEVPYDQRKIYHPGCQYLQYWEALDFSRQRHFANGDYTRQRHQQQLLMAMFKKVMSKGTITDLGTVTALQKSAGGLLTLDLGGQSLENWAYTLRNIRPDNVVMIKTNDGKVTPAPNPDGSKCTHNCDELLSEDSMALLAAIRDDKVYEFLVQHPSWITPPD